MPAAPSKARRIVDIALDEESVARRTPEVEHERAVAMFDLLEENDFCLVDGDSGPYKLHIGVFEQRLVFGVHAADDRKLRDIVLSLTPFRKVVKDYFMVCESYYAAACTTRAPSCCASGWPASSRWISTPRGGSSP